MPMVNGQRLTQGPVRGKGIVDVGIVQYSNLNQGFHFPAPHNNTLRCISHSYLDIHRRSLLLPNHIPLPAPTVIPDTCDTHIDL